MATEKKTKEQRLAELEEKQKQLKAQARKLKASISQEERKKRTQLLIKAGGIITSVLGRDLVESDMERLAAFLKGQDSRGGYFSKAMNDYPKNEVIQSPATSNEEK